MTTEADLRAVMDNIFEGITDITCHERRRIRYAGLIGNYEGLLLLMATSNEQREMLINQLNQLHKRYSSFKEKLDSTDD
jgi:hypothetical protein